MLKLAVAPAKSAWRFASTRARSLAGVPISACGGDVWIIASIEDPAVIQKILAHLDGNATSAASGLLPECRAPPGPPMRLFV